MVRGGLGKAICTFRMANEPLPYLTKVILHHYIAMSYKPNISNKFAVRYVCLHKVYVPGVHS